DAARAGDGKAVGILLASVALVVALADLRAVLRRQALRRRGAGAEAEYAGAGRIGLARGTTVTVVTPARRLTRGGGDRAGEAVLPRAPVRVRRARLERRVVAAAGADRAAEGRDADRKRGDIAVPRRGTISGLGAGLAGLAASAADDRAVAHHGAQLAVDAAVADVGAVCLRHAARAVDAAGAGLWQALGILGATRARLDAAMAGVGRTNRRRAGRDGATGIFRIGRQQVAARRVVSDAAHLRLAGLRVREHAALVERAAAGLRARGAGLRGPV